MHQHEGSGRRVAAFVRHGHFDRPECTASAHLPIPLSATGRQQARDAVEPLLRFCDEQGLEPDPQIESSQLIRAWETAVIMAEELERRTSRVFRVEERLELIERGLGSCANLRFDEIEAVLALDPRLDPLPEGWRRIPDFRLAVPGAESLLEAGGRVAEFVSASLASIPEEDPRDVLRLFVAHGGCLRHAALRLGVLDRALVGRLTMDYGQAVLIERCEDGRWIHSGGQWKKRLSVIGSVDFEENDQP